ncbi:MAG: hypothetical protein AAF713_08745 [Pseudomonadota bacterium]
MRDQAAPAIEAPAAPALPRVDAGRLWRGALWALIGLVGVVPFILVIAISFGEKIEGAAWVWGFDTANYSRFFVGIGWPDEISFLFSQKLFFSLYYAAIAAVLAVILAFPFTYLMTRQKRRTQAVWLVFLLASLSLSEVFVVMGWDVLLSNRSGLPMVFRETGITAWLKEAGYFDTLREWGLANPRDVKFKTSAFATILTLTYLVWPYAVILLYPALSRLDTAMLEAARTMGARPLVVVRTVVLPAMRIPLIGATLLLFVFLLGAYVTITVFAAPAQHTLTLSIYDAIRGQTLNAPFGAAQAVVLLGTAGLLLGASALLARWAERRA